MHPNITNSTISSIILCKYCIGVMELQILFTLLLLIAPGLSQSECRSDAFPPKRYFSTSGGVNYQLPDTTRGTGYLVIAPQMSFNCHGYITGWSALTRFASTDIAIQYLKHDITFQLWRPRARSSSVYDFIGSHHLGFIGSTLRRGTTVVDGTQFFNFTSAQPQSSGQSPLYFQPGDVVGWYIHTLVQSIDIPLTVVYKDASGSLSDPNLRSIDLYSTEIDDAHAHKLPPCELSLNSDRTTRVSSVIPYVNVDYVSTGSSQTQNGQVPACTNQSR